MPFFACARSFCFSMNFFKKGVAKRWFFQRIVRGKFYFRKYTPEGVQKLHFASMPLTTVTTQTPARSKTLRTSIRWHCCWSTICASKAIPIPSIASPAVPEPAADQAKAVWCIYWAGIFYLVLVIGALMWYNGCVNQGSFHRGKEFDNVRKKKRQQRPRPMDRREPAQRSDLPIPLHRCNGQKEMFYNCTVQRKQNRLKIYTIFTPFGGARA